MPFVLNLLAKNQCIPKMIASIEEENFYIGLDARDHVQERHALRLKRSADGDIRREFIHRPLNNFLRRFCFELSRKRGDFFLRFHG